MDKYKKYRSCNKKCKDSLFKFWKKCKNKLENISLSQSSNIDDSTMNSLRIDNSNTDTQLSNTEGISKPQDMCKDGEISPHKIQLGERELTLGSSKYALASR